MSNEMTLIEPMLLQYEAHYDEGATWLIKAFNWQDAELVALAFEGALNQNFIRLEMVGEPTKDNQ